MKKDLVNWLEINGFRNELLTFLEEQNIYSMENFFHSAQRLSINSVMETFKFRTIGRAAQFLQAIPKIYRTGSQGRDVKEKIIASVHVHKIGAVEEHNGYFWMDFTFTLASDARMEKLPYINNICKVSCVQNTGQYYDSNKHQFIIKTRYRGYFFDDFERDLFPFDNQVIRISIYSPWPSFEDREILFQHGEIDFDCHQNRVSQVEPESPAQRAGVSVGWIIISLNGKAIHEEDKVGVMFKIKKIQNSVLRQAIRITFRKPCKKIAVETGSITMERMNHPQWIIVPSMMSQIVFTDNRHTTDKNVFSEIENYVIIHRKFSFYIFNYVLVLWIITTITWCIYGYNYDQMSERMDILMPLMIAVVMFRVQITSCTPDLPYLTWMDKYVHISFAYFLLVTVATAIIPQILDEDLAMKIDFVFMLSSIGAWCIFSVYILTSIIMKLHSSNKIKSAVSNYWNSSKKFDYWVKKDSSIGKRLDSQSQEVKDHLDIFVHSNSKVAEEYTV